MFRGSREGQKAPWKIVLLERMFSTQKSNELTLSRSWTMHFLIKLKPQTTYVHFFSWNLSFFTRNLEKTEEPDNVKF